MASTLQQIVSETRARLASDTRPVRRRELERLAAEHTPRGFRRHLQQFAEDRPAVIAELKKASPSRGLIREHFPVSELARQLEEAGAAALSVLTEERHFQGSLENLRAASQATKLPCLRKDFIVDELQLLEARAYCADAALLIVAALNDEELKTLVTAAREFELDILCEVHDAEELRRALDAGIKTIGVNNRDLHTFAVTLETSLRLSGLIPAHALRVAESGIHRGEDIARLRTAGYQGFLIGESLMKQTHPGKALSGLLADAERESRKAEVARR